MGMVRNMKKLLVILLFFPIFVSAQFDSKYEAYKHISIDDELKYYTDQLRHFYRAHDIDIDYRNIRGFRVIHGEMRDQNGFGLAGYYREDNVILIRDHHPVAKNFGIYEQIMLVTIAHEIGHSQGFLHDTTDVDNLMYYSNGKVYDNLILKRKTLTEILLSPYIKD